MRLMLKSEMLVKSKLIWLSFKFDWLLLCLSDVKLCIESWLAELEEEKKLC